MTFSVINGHTLWERVYAPISWHLHICSSKFLQTLPCIDTTGSSKHHVNAPRTDCNIATTAPKSLFCIIMSLKYARSLWEPWKLTGIGTMIIKWIYDSGIHSIRLQGEEGSGSRQFEIWGGGVGHIYVSSGWNSMHHMSIESYTQWCSIGIFSMMMHPVMTE